MLTPEQIVDNLLEGEQMEIDFPFNDGEDPQSIDPKELLGSVPWLADPKEFIYVKEKEPPHPPWGIYVEREEYSYFDVHWKRQINKLTGQPVLIGTIGVTHDERGTPVWSITHIPTHMGFFKKELSDRTFTSRFGCARELLKLHKDELRKAGTLERVMHGH